MLCHPCQIRSAGESTLIIYLSHLKMHISADHQICFQRRTCEIDTLSHYTWYHIHTIRQKVKMSANYMTMQTFATQQVWSLEDTVVT